MRARSRSLADDQRMSTLGDESLSRRQFRQADACEPRARSLACMSGSTRRATTDNRSGKPKRARAREICATARAHVARFPPPARARKQTPRAPKSASRSHALRRRHRRRRRRRRRYCLLDDLAVAAVAAAAAAAIVVVVVVTVLALSTLTTAIRLSAGARASKPAVGSDGGGDADDKNRGA